MRTKAPTRLVTMMVTTRAPLGPWRAVSLVRVGLSPRPSGGCGWTLSGSTIGGSILSKVAMACTPKVTSEGATPRYRRGSAGSRNLRRWMRRHALWQTAREAVEAQDASPDPSMADITLPAVFLAGLVSFLSPCVLPLAPPYLTFLAGATLDEMTDRSVGSGVRRRALILAALFVAGFATVFIALGATASALGQLIRQHLDLLGAAAGLLIIVMGLHFLGLFRVTLFYRQARWHGPRSSGPVAAYLMGLAFAF